ncbi:MAG: VIT and VWA domain-containing protein [Desulfomonile sp.]|nr:VIT and VWA domain-containing protein [Desulfomonile sp.]
MGSNLTLLKAAIFAAAALAVSLPGISPGAALGQGSLTIIQPDGSPGAECALEHTSVNGEVSGFIARVSVTQLFHNSSDKKIEAVYTFPLSADAAVDDMLMRVGDREIRGVIKPRDEARAIYERAVQRGHVASLLDQERPNIFTQSVANIMPGQKVEITIKYVETLPYDDGAFQFVFPLVVGPRFIPGQPVGQSGTGWASDTTIVPDASRITPPVTPEGSRAGHDIDLTVSIDAGVPISNISSRLHEVDVRQDVAHRAVVSLKNKKEIPNRDFVLRYDVAGDEIRSGVLTHKQGKDGYAMIIVIPPKRPKPAQIAGKEMIFVIDCSGSQMGWPLEKAKETMRYFIDHMNPCDTFNIVDFNVGARMLFSEPKPNTPENRTKALEYLKSLQARGGTWMGPAVETVAKTKPPKNRLRIVTFMTDGYVGNDFEIIALVKQLRGKSRWFPFGTGNSVNRFLLDTMAKAGGGEVEYVLLNSSAEEAARRFYERIAAPVLTDVSIFTEGISLQDVFPAQISDLWSRRPLMFKTRYSLPGIGKVVVSGFTGGKPYRQSLDVTLPDAEARNDAIASLWARAKVDMLMEQDFMGIQRGAPKPEVKDEIVRIALAHRLMTQFTSFVAVEEAVVTVDGKPVKVTIPVEMADGVSREGTFGEADAMKSQTRMAPESAPVPQAAKPGVPPAFARGVADTVRSFRLMKATGGQIKAEGAEAGGSPLSRDDVRTPADDLHKLSSELRALVEPDGAQMPATKNSPAAEDGKVKIRIVLSDRSDEVIRSLEALEVRVLYQATAGKTVAALAPVDKLRELVKLKQVIFVQLLVQEP